MSASAFASMVQERADQRCEYCRMHQSLQGATFHVEHIVPSSRGGVSASDYLDTVVTVVRGRTVLATYPILINQPSSVGGPWFAQPNEDRRVAQLGVTLGQWIRRKVGA